MAIEMVFNQYRYCSALQWENIFFHELNCFLLMTFKTYQKVYCKSMRYKGAVKNRLLFCWL